ncbi:MAG: glycosyltransferase family 2 protein [Gammaproteobacteria bacterium]
MTLRHKQLVSVVIPAFNARHTISLAIQSGLSQTVDVEIVVCDDASEDETASVVEGYSDDRIRLIRNEKNMGEGPARDRAIAEARGEWIALLDADDAWHPRRLEGLLDAAGADTDRMVFDDILECHHNSRALVPWRRMRGNGAYGAHGVGVDVPIAEWARSKRLLIKPLIPAASLRASGVVHSRRRFGEDTEFFLKLLAAGLKLRYLPEAYYYYRISPGSMTASRLRHIQMEEVLEQAIMMFANNEAMVESLRLRLKQEQRNETYSRFMWALKDRDYTEAMRRSLAKPWLIAELFKRTVHELPYHGHRIWHRGSGRN